MTYLLPPFFYLTAFPFALYRPLTAGFLFSFAHTGFFAANRRFEFSREAALGKVGVR
jgi:hypothetical protein